jgi:hypothetical protein
MVWKRQTETMDEMTPTSKSTHPHTLSYCFKSLASAESRWRLAEPPLEAGEPPLETGATATEPSLETGVTAAEAASYCTGAEEGLSFQHGLMSKKSARVTTKEMILGVGQMTMSQAAAALGVSQQLLMHCCTLIWKEGGYTWTKISGLQFTSDVASGTFSDDNRGT